MNQYRLKQINTDGKSSLSIIRSIVFGTDAGVQLYPNPVSSGTVRVQGNNISSIAVYNISGQQLTVPVTYGVSENDLNISGLSSGNYVVRVATANSVNILKLVVQH